MYLDIILVVILIIMIFKGIKDGFLIEFFSIFGIFIDYIIAQKFTYTAMKKFNITDTQGNYILTYISIFIISYIIVSTVMIFLGKVYKNQNEGIISRTLGGVFGLLKGLIIVGIILFIFNYTSKKFTVLENYTSNSKVNEYFLEKINLVEEYIPQELKKEIKRVKDKKIIEKYFDKIF